MYPAGCTGTTSVCESLYEHITPGEVIGEVMTFLLGAVLTAGAVVQPPASPGKGFAKATATSAPVTSRPPLAKFEAWAKEQKIEKTAPLEITDFSGEYRGVAAGAEIAAGARVLSVPSRLALQVTSVSPKPRWCDEDTWFKAKWDARLAMTLLHEEADARSDLKPWLAQLPQAFNTPVLWPNPQEVFRAIGYPSLGATVSKQREEWDATRKRAPGSPSAERWDWAMNVVRSRAFSGPYAPSTFIGSLLQLFGASTLAVAYALGVGGAGAADQALDFFLLAVVFVICNDFVFGPRLSRAKRYVICPWIDMLNHDGALSGSDVAYEYFADSFAVRLDEAAGPVGQGQEVLISYGERSNDVLLQYYGFVQPANPHDQVALEQEQFILAVDTQQGLSAAALPALKAAGLADPSACFGAFNAEGATETALRIARLLLQPEAAKDADAGASLLDPATEASVRLTLAAVAQEQREKLSVPTKLPNGVPREVLEAFVNEKRRVLEASENALRVQAGA
jgi:hypothetical protein